MRTLSALMTAFLLISCGDSGQEARQAQEAAAKPNVPAAQVAALPPLQRNGVFLRAIRDSDIPCQDVAQSEAITIAKDKPGWRAQCTNGDGHLIEILPDGTARVTSRAH